MGGAVFNEAGTVIITNSTVTGNTAKGGAGGHVGGGQGGGPFNHNGAITVTNSTFSDNTADQGGRGILLFGDRIFNTTDATTATAFIANSIIGQADTKVEDFTATSNGPFQIFTGGSGNLIRTQSGFTGTIVSTQDPKLGLLQNNGGPTPTMALAADSPAIGAGMALANITTDQRGVLRAKTPSIGAYEGPSLTLSSTSLDLGTTTFGTANVAVKYTVSGNALTGNVLVMASPGAELSRNGTTWSSSLTLTPSNYTLASTTIEVRISAGATAGSFRGVLRNTGGGASEQDVSLSGTVNRATPTVRVRDAGGTYTGSPFKATATVAGVNGVAGPSLEGATPTLTYYAGTYTLGSLPASGGSGTAPRTAGTYTVVASFPCSKDYDRAQALATFTIARATLTVTANNASRIYGAVNPAFTYRISGFVNNDPASVVSGTPTLTTTATADSPPGRFTIAAAAGTLSAASYTFRLVNGTLTVLPAPVSAGIFTWIGVTSGDWFTASNWSTEAVPGPADTAVIKGAPFAPVLSAIAAVGGLVVDGGSLTLDANLTDNGTFSQDSGSIVFGSNADQLQIAGDVHRTGGVFLGSVGTVVLDGSAGQTVMDTSFNKLPALTISNTSAAGVTLPGGSTVGVRTGGGVTLNAGATLTLMQGTAASFLIDRGNFTDNGNIVLSQLSPNGGGTTALITVNGTLAFGGTSAFDLSVANLAANAAYTFMTYGATTGAVGTTTVHGNFPFAATTGVGTSSLTVTLSSPGTIDTWTGAVSNDWNTAANWTAADGSHVVPGAQDLAVISGAPFSTVLNANATVGSLQFANGFLTLDANLTVTGAFSPDGGFIAFGSDADQLILDGNFTRKSGTFLGAAGTVVFGGAAQSVTDTSGRAFGWNMVVNSGSAVTMQPGSAVTVGNDFTDNGTVNLSMAAPSSATPLVVGHNLVEGAGSVFNLTLGDTSAGLVYIFITFGGTDPAGATFTANAGTVHRDGNGISVAM